MVSITPYVGVHTSRSAVTPCPAFASHAASSSRSLETRKSTSSPRRPARVDDVAPLRCRFTARASKGSLAEAEPDPLARGVPVSSQGLASSSEGGGPGPTGNPLGPNEPKIPVNQGRLLLVLVAALWGTYGVIARDVFLLPHPPPVSIFTFIRKLMAACSFFLLQPFSRSSIRPPPVWSSEASPETSSEPSNKLLPDPSPPLPPSTSSASTPPEASCAASSLFLASLELGLWQFAGTAVQALGLQATSATRAGFLVQTTNVMVPLISSFSGESIPKITWLAALVATAGVVIMGAATAAPSETAPSDATSAVEPDTSAEGLWAAPEALAEESLVGDLEVLAAAVFYSLSTVRLGALVKDHNAFALSAGNMYFAAGFAGVWAAYDLATAELQGDGAASLLEGWADQPGVWISIALSALGPGTLASLAQTYGQKAVPPSQAQVIYALQPLFAAVLAAAFLHETLPPLGYVGGGLVVLASFLEVAL